MDIKAKLYNVFGENVWIIGYRSLNSLDESLVYRGNGNFKLIKTGRGKWAADPIIRKINGYIYIFAELYDISEKKGIIAATKYNDNKKLFEQFVPIITEPFHMSFPEVFEYDGKMLMLPETHEVSQLRFYEMKGNPYKWELKCKLNTEYGFSDTVVIRKGYDLYLITTEKPEDNPFLSRLHVFKIDGFGKRDIIKLSEISVQKEYNYSDRNGGSVFRNNEEMVRVIQNADYGWYGKEIVFRRIIELNNENFAESDDFQTITSGSIHCDLPLLCDVRGIHTYGVADGMEVIDINMQRITPGSIKKGMGIVRNKLLRRHSKKKEIRI